MMLGVNMNNIDHEIDEEEEVPQAFHYKIVQELSNQRPPVLLFKKKLNLTDVARSQNRLLLITEGDRESVMEALTVQERAKIDGMKRNDLLRVVATDNTHGVEYTLQLRKWRATSHATAIVLAGEWRKLVAANGFKKGDYVQGWGYRIRNQFRLALLHN